MQDFWVSVTLSIIVAIVKKEANEKIKERTKGKGNNRIYIPNVCQLVASLKDGFVLACRKSHNYKRKKAVSSIIHEISLSVTSVRPDRPPHARKTQLKKKQYPINRKSNI